MNFVKKLEILGVRILPDLVWLSAALYLVEDFHKLTLKCRVPLLVKLTTLQLLKVVVWLLMFWSQPSLSQLVCFKQHRLALCKLFKPLLLSIEAS